MRSFFLVLAACGGGSDPQSIDAARVIDVSLATIDGKAQLLGEYEVFHGDWLKLFDAPAQFDRVSRAEVQAVAREILDKRRRTVGVLVPEDGAAVGEEDAA